MRDRSLFKTGGSLKWAPLLSVVVTSVLVCVVGLVGIVQDMKSIRRFVYNSEISQARSHVDRTVGRIELDLIEGQSLDGYRVKANPRWLVDHWRRTIPGKPERLYGAIVDSDNNILAHSDYLDAECTATEQLESDWNRSPISIYGDNVHEITGTVLSEKIRAIDICSPITFNGEVVGQYHSGLELSWLETLVWNAQQESIRGWGMVIVTIGAIVTASSVVLYRLGLHTKRLENALEQSETRRLADLSRLIVGLAHELRNPLNAIRLNLFNSEKVFRGQTEMPKTDAVSMVRESVREVERMDDLIGQLLGYARADIRKHGECNVENEMTSLLQFLKHMHESRSINVIYSGAARDLWIRMDSKHLRQVMLNLFSNAQEALPNGGIIAIRVESGANDAVVRFQDNGPGVALDQYDKIFEPFYSTRDHGVGMGLAVVDSLIDASHGSICCRRSTEYGGMEFIITLPAFHK